MGNAENKQEVLLDLGWNDFSSYPNKWDRIIVRASGFDVNGRVWRHLFFDIRFNPFDFPDDAMSKKLRWYRVKWIFFWLPKSFVAKKIDNIEI